MQAGSLQPRQTIAIRLLAMPPVVRTFIALFVSEWFFWLTAEQTFMQVKQPRHLVISFGRRTLPISLPPPAGPKTYTVTHTANFLVSYYTSVQFIKQE